MKRAFKVKQKTFFLVSQLLSFRHTKETSKNVAESATYFIAPKYLRQTVLLVF